MKRILVSKNRYKPKRFGNLWHLTGPTTPPTDVINAPSGFIQRGEPCRKFTRRLQRNDGATLPPPILFSAKYVFNLDARHCAELIRSESSALGRVVVSATGIAKLASFA